MFALKTGAPVVSRARYEVFLKDWCTMQLCLVRGRFALKDSARVSPRTRYNVFLEGWCTSCVVRGPYIFPPLLHLSRLLGKHSKAQCR